MENQNTFSDSQLNTNERSINNDENLNDPITQ